MTPFKGCWERVERAQTHCNALSEAWNSFLVTDCYSASVRVDHDGTGSILIAPKYDVFPSSFSLDLGEMLYQLRAALDGSVYQAAVLESGQDPPPDEKHLEFPICPTAAEFKKASRHIAPLPQELYRLIESVQPYSAPDLAPELTVMNFNRTLSILHDWARIDRHRRLHMISSWASNANPKLRLPEGVRLAEMIVTGTGFLKDECEVATFRLDGFIPGMPVQGNPDLMIDIAVNESPPPCADNDTSGNRLRAMFVTVRTLIASIEGHFAE